MTGAWLGPKRPTCEELGWRDSERRHTAGCRSRADAGLRARPWARGRVSGELRAGGEILRVMLKGENPELRREGPESSWKRPSRTRMVRSWPPSGREFRAGAVVGWGPGWGVGEDTQDSSVWEYSGRVSASHDLWACLPGRWKRGPG